MGDYNSASMGNNYRYDLDLQEYIKDKIYKN